MKKLNFKQSKIIIAHTRVYLRLIVYLEVVFYVTNKL